MAKSKTLIKESKPKPLPPHIRKRLTFQAALLSDPRRYMNSMRFERHPKPKPKKKKILPKPVVENEETQTLDVNDAETNTKIPRLSHIQCTTRKLKKARSTLSKTHGGRARSRSTSKERKPQLRGIFKPEGGLLISTSSISTKKITDIQKPLSPQRARVTSELKQPDPPGVKKHRGILKKSVHETPEGMCSQGTVTERKTPHLSRILKENHIFMKYSNNCKPKKKRVRVDKKPMFSYLSKKGVEKESEQSLASECERPRRVVLADEVKCISDASEDFSDSLERKQAQCVLGRTPQERSERKPTRCVLGRVPLEVDASNAEPGSASGVSLVVYQASSAPQLNALQKTSLLPPPAPATPLPPPRKVPKERLYFRNMFSRIPPTNKR